MKYPLTWCVALLGISTFVRAETIETEICVYGGTAGGVATACSATRLGHKAVLLEFGRHVGGLTSGGLGWTDIGNKAAIGGIAREFYQRLGKYYGKPEAWTFEPHVAEQELEKMLAESGVPLYREARLATVKKDGQRITEITTTNGTVVRAKMFVDCTYEGDLMAKAGVSFMVGREANSRFGETLNGVRARTPAHQFTVAVDPYVKPGDPSSGLLSFIQPGPSAAPGEGDACVQAYNYRLCLTKNPDNKRPIDPPEGYNAKDYELLGRYCEALVAAGKKVTLRSFLKIDMVTPEKTDVNNNGGFSTDDIGANYAYPNADYATREKICKDHERYIRGLLTFLATDRRVPEEVRTDMQQWGLCKDEFKDTGGWPHQLYVREARRMIGEMVMTESVCRGAERPEDSVGLGAYNMDSHNCQRLVKDDHAENEGDTQVGVKPYPISYRAIVPKAAECENLWVPICLSATHISYGSIRMEPVFMILGQSSATAACMAIEQKTTAQKVDYAKLQEQLLKEGQVLAWTDRAKGQSHDHAELEQSVKWEGLLFDAGKAKLTGEWAEGSIANPRGISSGYIHDDNAGKGEKSAQWKPEISEAGEYEIVFHFPPGPNRAQNVPVTVDVNGHATSVKINERDGKSGGVASLGKFQLPKGTAATVTVSNAGTDGHVVVDGIQIVPVARK